MPETVMLDMGWPLSENAQDDIDSKKRKASKEIRVEAMREAVEFSQRTSARGRGKAVLVFPAERMNIYTANALLKTLEEPPEYAFIILNTKGLDYLLPTVVSRCQKLLVTGDSATPVVTGDEKSNTYISIIKMSLGERLDLAGELAKEEKEDLIEMAEGWANELGHLKQVRKSDVSNVKNILAFKKDLENTNINVRIAIESLFLNFN